MFNKILECLDQFLKHFSTIIYKNFNEFFKFE